MLQQVDQDNGAWMLPMLRLHIDPMAKHTVENVSKKEITPLPLRIHDAAYNENAIIARMEAAVDNTPTVLKSSTSANFIQKGGKGFKGHGNGTGQKRVKTHARGFAPKREKKKN